MSMSQLPPVGAMKPPQRARTVTTGQTTDVTISAVDPAKTQITLLGFSTLANGLTDLSLVPRIHLENSTTLRIFSYQGGSGTFITVSWELVEQY